MSNHSTAIRFLDWVRGYRNRTGHNPSERETYQAGFVAGVRRERAERRAALKASAGEKEKQT